DSGLIFGEWQYMAGVYYDTLSNVNGCDSILSCELIVNPIYNDTVQVQICAGDSIWLGGNWQNSSGYYSDSLQTVQGCDSIITTELMVLPHLTTSSTAEICQGDSTLIFGQWQSMADIYSDTVQSSSGCDSIHIITLTVKPTAVVNVMDSICPGDGRFIGGGYQTTAGVYYD